MAMGAEDGGYCVPDGGGIGDIRGVCGYSGDAVGVGGGGVKDAVGCREGGANRSGFGLTSRKCLERLAAALMAPSPTGWCVSGYSGSA